MKIIDLTHNIHPQMPVYPGTEAPLFETANTYEKDGFTEKRITMYSHTGTHADVPAHIFPDGLSLDKLPASLFIGTGLVIDGKTRHSGPRLSMDHIDKALADKADFLLFNWGWDEYWGSPGYFEDYPCIGEDIADYVIKSGKKGIGVDAISIDPVADHQLTLHHKLLRENIIIIENLTNLSLIGPGLFTFAALPLKIAGGDGAPVRAIAMLKRLEQLEQLEAAHNPRS